MKKVAICTLWLTLSACAGIVKHTEDSFWPFDNPNAPKGESENMRRVRGESVFANPIVAEKGDIWPGEPDPVPTLQDVSNPDSHFNETFHRSLKTLDNDLEHQPFEDGESLAIGEEVATRNGVRRNSASIGSPLPDSVEDNAPAYLQGANRDTVAIPNGDGTTTMVAPDGSVTIMRGAPDNPQKAAAANNSVEAKPLPSIDAKLPPQTISPDAGSASAPAASPVATGKAVSASQARVPERQAHKNIRKKTVRKKGRSHAVRFRRKHVSKSLTRSAQRRKVRISRKAVRHSRHVTRHASLTRHVHRKKAVHKLSRKGAH